MSKAFGIINFARNDVHVSGMLDYRPIEIGRAHV